ncbi:MAG: hypothetical protein HY513_04450 [Candidatus Aenigmarchaeota archaeon]|nr:hypothetical protein [Candidatus Aenigmarchaeota archaeon]
MEYLSKFAKTAFLSLALAAPSQSYAALGIDCKSLKVKRSPCGITYVLEGDFKIGYVDLGTDGTLDFIRWDYGNGVSELGEAKQ